MKLKVNILSSSKMAAVTPIIESFRFYDEDENEYEF